MSKFMSPRLDALTAYVPGEQPRDMQYIKLNTNESPYPPAPSVELASADVEALRLYSDPTAKGLKEKLAGLYEVEPENIFVGNGSDEVLNFAFLAYGGEGVCFPDITYGFYTVFCDLYGEKYDQIPLKEDFSVDYRDYCGAGKMVVIANPNAPTGMSIPVWQIEQILKSNPTNVVLIDEAYVDFGGASCYRLMEKYGNLLVSRTFSKSRCLAGGRLGYAIGPKELIADLEKLKYSTNPYNVDRLTLKLGEATVDAEDYYRQVWQKVISVREYTAAALKELGFAVLPSDANFVFARTERMDGGELYRKLKERGILVRHFTNPRIDQFLRVTIGTQEQMEKFIETVKAILT